MPQKDKYNGAELIFKNLMQESFPEIKEDLNYT